MKKIITASLVAMMAVTAANAEIASVEYVDGKTGDITELTTTARSNLTAAVNELNTGVQAAATKTELEQGLATKQDTIDDLAAIRSGAALGATSLQADDIVNEVPDGDQTVVAPSVELTNSLISDANTTMNAALMQKADKATIGTVEQGKTVVDMINDAKNAASDAVYDDTEVRGLISAEETARGQADAAIRSEFAAADATTLQSAKDYADQAEADAIAAAGNAADGKIAAALEDYSTTTEMNQAIATATTDMATTGDVATAKSEAIAEAKEAADAAYDVKGAAAQALADAKADAVKYIDATELEQSQTAQNTALQEYADQAEADAIAAAATDATNKADAAQAAAIAAAATDATTKADAAQEAAEQTAAAKYQGKSSALSVGAADGAWTDLTKVDGYSATGTHSLVLKEGSIQWEAIRY